MIYVCRTQPYHIFSRSSLQPHRLPTDLAMLVHWPAMPLHSFSLLWLQFTWQFYRAYSSSLCKADPWGIRMFLKKRIEYCVLALFAKLAVVFILTCICMERTNNSYIPPSSALLEFSVPCYETEATIFLSSKAIIAHVRCNEVQLDSSCSVFAFSVSKGIPPVQNWLLSS